MSCRIAIGVIAQVRQTGRSSDDIGSRAQTGRGPAGSVVISERRDLRAAHNLRHHITHLGHVLIADGPAGWQSESALAGADLCRERASQRCDPWRAHHQKHEKSGVGGRGPLTIGRT